VSAGCGDCKLLLVEATSSSSFATAVTTAAGLGVAAITNSYGATESAADLQNAAIYSQYGNFPVQQCPVVVAT